MELTRELKSFRYALVRFVPDRVRGESLNLGVIVVSESTGEAAGEFLRKFKSRIRALDPLVSSTVVERLLDTLRNRVGESQGGILTEDRLIQSSKDISALADTMKNQLQVTEPKPYRAASLRAAVSELYSELVSPQRRPPTSQRGMSLPQLRRLIRNAIRSWGGDWYSIEEDRIRQGHEARHYADFWLESGRPLAAFIAIPDDPGERDLAWMRRDSVPTIATEFRTLDHDFKTVVVFPPNGRHPTTEFVSETMDLLRRVDGVIVTHADELHGERDRIAPRFL